MKKYDEILLDINNVVKAFKIPSEKLFSSKKRIFALDGISFKLRYGESFGIVGESGSGKSTLARTIMGLDIPQSGEIIFMGKDIHSLNPKDLRRTRKSLQMIFQDPYGSLDPKQTINKIVSEPLSLFGGIQPFHKKDKVLYTLDKVGLSPNDLNKYPQNYLSVI